MNPNQPTSRRRFLQASIALPAALSAVGGVRAAPAAPAAKADTATVLPRRKLGRNGPEVTMLNIGGMMAAHNPQYLDLAWKM